MTKSKIWKLVISVVVAFSLWVYVVSVVSPGTEMTFYDIEVKIMDKGALKDVDLILTDYDKTVTVRLEGNRSDLNLLDEDNLKAYAYVAGSTTEDTQIEYTIDLPDSVAGNAIVVQKKNPEKLNIKIEKLEKKNVPVTVKLEGELMEGYVMNPENPDEDPEKVLSHTEVEVIAPESLINKIEYAVITLDLEDRTASIDEDYEFILCDKDKKPVEADPELIDVTTTDKIHVSLPILLYRELPLEVKLNPGGGATADNCQVTIGPVQSIMVAGPKDVLEGMDSLVIDTVELKDLLEDETRTIDLEEVLEKKQLVNTTDIKEVTVQLDLKGLSTRSITTDNIQVQKPDDLHYNVNSVPESVTIEVRGPSALVNQLTENDVQVVLDLSAVQSGGLRAVTPKVVLPEKFEDLAVTKKQDIYVEVNS